MFVPDIINIVDTQTPIMVMVGPPSSGKTMVAYRLFAWLANRGYTVDVDRILYPATFTKYQQFASNFHSTLFSRFPNLATTQHLALYKVHDTRGYPILQIIDSQGSEWVDSNNESLRHGFHSAQINQVIGSPNKKIWTYITEPNWGTAADRKSYVESIWLLQVATSRKDKHIVLLNKVDKDVSLTHKGIECFLDMQYPALFETFRNKDFLFKWFRKYYCDILPFMTGQYNMENDHAIFTNGPDTYPEILWKKINSKL